ncbi:MAG: transcription termination factor Rho [Opitutaceae bacterium]
MALPPKSDADTPSAASAAEKKTRRLGARTRTAKPAAAKPAKTEKPAKPARPIRARRGAAKVETPDAPATREMNFAAEHAPAAPAERPVFVPREQSPASAPEYRPEPREAPAPAPEAHREFHGEPRAPAEASRDDSRSDVAPASAPPSETQPSQPHHQPHPQNSGGGGGGRPEWQGQHGGQGGGGGQDRGDRGFWKHGKRKRGRHGGGQWQPGGGGGGGHGAQGGHGGREQLPPQLPPPSNTPVFGDLPNPSRFNDLGALDALAAELAAGTGEAIALHEVYAKTLVELTAFARQLGVKFDGAPPKRQLLTEIFKFAATEKRPVRDVGHIDQNDRGHFIVHEHVNYRLYPEDAYLPDSLVKRYGLKRGHRVEVLIQPPLEGERCPSAVRVDRVQGLDPQAIANVTPFEELVPYYPLKRILLEDPEVVKDMSMRAVDILTPIGFGQRGLIVAPPRTGKTVLLQNIANSVSANFPEVKLILLLIDERPEEVTDFKRHTKGEVVSSTFDETPESHVHCAEMVIEIARRRIEQGEHVVILLDSITRLARAYNALAGNQGKTMSGGLESNALQKPKRFFGSARNIEGGGSLTIIASALIDTGSRMDEIIFEEFKGTGNSELHLDRGLVERRIFPAINIDRSGTRKEELIYHPEELQRIYGLRRAMQGLGPIESMEMLITRLKKTKSNAEFLMSLAPK